MGSPLTRLKKDAFPSMMDTATANRLIDAINGFRSMVVAPNGAGKLTVGESGVILDLNGLIKLLSKTTTSQDAINQTTSPGQPGVPGGGGGGGGTELNNKINGVINALNNSAINATCNPDGSVSVTLVIPGLPPPT